MKVVDLFAGAGGASLGIQAAGCEHLACVEWDEDASATLKASGFPVVFGDVRDLSLVEGLAPDLVWSSFPCTPWSTGGKRERARDPQGRDGWPWTVNMLEFLAPRWFIAENVEGLTQHRGACARGCRGIAGRCAAAYLDREILQHLRSRFDRVDHRVLDAADYGVPQHRRRLIVVAGPSSIDFPEPTHARVTAQCDLFGRNPIPWATVGDTLGLEGIMHTGGEDYRDRDDRKTRERPAPTSEPSPTVGSRGNAMVTDRVDGRRGLTPAECAALQGFPADHPWQGNPTSVYTQIGNAVPPALAEAVVRAVLAADNSETLGDLSQSSDDLEVRGNQR